MVVIGIFKIIMVTERRVVVSATSLLILVRKSQGDCS